MKEAEVIEKLKSFKEALTRFKEENIKLKEQVVTLQTNYNNFAETAKGEAEDYQDQIEQLKQENEKLKNDYESLKAQTVVSLKKNNEYIEELEAKLRNSGNLSETIEKLTTDVDKIVSSNVLTDAERRYEELSKNNEKVTATKKYRFGRTSEAVKNQFASFLDGLFNGAQFIDDVWQLRDIEDAKSISNADEHMIEVFMSRVESVKYKGKKLIYRNPQGVLVSPFDKDFVVTYLCEEE